MNEQSVITIRCPRCGQVLAQSDGYVLTIGAAAIDRLVTLRCAAVRCGGRVVWRPVAAVGEISRMDVLVLTR